MGIKKRGGIGKNEKRGLRKRFYEIICLFLGEVFVDVRFLVIGVSNYDNEMDRREEVIEIKFVTVIELERVKVLFEEVRKVFFDFNMGIVIMIL